MSNINKIKVSGQTYNIEDVNASKTVELTQAQYDALVVKDPNTFYVITDAQGADLSNYYTKSETSGATEISTALASKADTATTYNKTEVDTALAGKQSTLVSGTNIKTINNESILGSGNINIQGGGKAVSGGTNISITTGETADTINCTLPMSTDSVKKIVVNSNYSSFVTSDAVFTANSLSNNILLGNNTYNIKGIIKGKINNNLIIGSYNTFKLTNGTSPTLEGNLVVGSNNQINSSHSLLVGYNSTISRGYQFAIGYNQNPSNEFEISLGAFNVSSSASATFGDSGNTLFSVGNGTSSARHNAFEIRQNGDIYLTKDGQDVKLQDQLGGGGGGITSGEVQTMIDESVSGKANSSDSTYSVNANIQNDGIYFTTLNKDGNQIDYSFEPQIRFQAPLYSDYNDGKVKISGVTAVTSASTDSEIPTAKAVNDKLGGLSLVKLTQAQYDALSPNYDSNTLYVVTDS